MQALFGVAGDVDGGVALVSDVAGGVDGLFVVGLLRDDRAIVGFWAGVPRLAYCRRGMAFAHDQQDRVHQHADVGEDCVIGKNGLRAMLCRNPLLTPACALLA